MIRLHQPPPAWGLPSMSPYCVKLETYFKMTGIPYERGRFNVRESPLGRIPYVTIDGKLMGDTSLIIERLKSLHGDPLDQKLSAEQRAQAVALQRLVEDHLYFAAAYLRWARNESWAYVSVEISRFLPKLIRKTFLGRKILGKIRKDFLCAIEGQGMGQHSEAQIIEFAKTDLSALSTLLGEKPFFLGADPTSIDATMYGFLIQQLGVPWESPVKAHALSLSNLGAYCERMKARYWG